MCSREPALAHQYNSANRVRAPPCPIWGPTNRQSLARPNFPCSSPAPPHPCDHPEERKPGEKEAEEKARPAALVHGLIFLSVHSLSLIAGSYFGGRSASTIQATTRTAS